MLSWNKVNVVSSLWSHLRYFGWHVGCYQIWHRYLCIINLFKKLMSLLVHLALGSQWSIRGTMSEVALTASINLLSINIQGTQDQVRKSPWPEVLDLVMDPRHHKLPFFFFWGRLHHVAFGIFVPQLGIEPRPHSESTESEPLDHQDLLSEGTLTGWVQQTFLGCICSWTKQNSTTTCLQVFMFKI